MIKFLLVFNFIFGIKIGPYFDTTNIASLLLIFWYLSRLKISKLEYGLLMISILIAIYQIFIISINNAFYDTWHLFQGIRHLINLVAVFILIRILDFNEILKLIVYSVVLHSIFVLAGMFVPEIKQATIALTGFVDKSELRFSGLTQSYGITAILHSFGILILLEYRKIFSNNFNFFSIAIIVLSQIFLARIGLLFSLIYLVIYFRNFIKLSNITYMIVFFIGINYLITQLTDYEELISLSLYRATDVFILFFEPEEVAALGTLTNTNMNNSTFLEMIFGSGHYGRGDLNTLINNDIAWLHLFSLGGFFLILLIMSLYVMPFQKIGFNLFFVILLLTLLICNIKESFLLTRSITPLYFILCLSYIRNFQYIKDSG